MIKITKNDGGCVVELVGCKTWQNVINYAYLREGVYLVSYENLPPQRVLHTCTITIAWGSKSYSVDYKTDNDGLLKVCLTDILKNVDSFSTPVTITFTRTIGSSTATITTNLFVVDGVCHSDVYNDIAQNTPNFMLNMPPTAMIQSDFLTQCGCSGNADGVHNYSFTNATATNWRSDYAFNLNIPSNTSKFTMYSGGDTVETVVNMPLTDADFVDTQIGYVTVPIATVVLPTSILPTSTNITCDYVTFGTFDTMRVTIISNEADGLHVQLRCNNRQILSQILMHYENVVPFDVTYTSFGYYNEFRLQQQTCGLHYCTLKWLGFNGMWKIHTFEINDYDIATSESIELMNVQSKFDILRNNDFSFTAKIQNCTRYDLFYYSDLIGSDKVYCYLHDVDSASAMNDVVLADYYRVSVETKNVTIPNGDAKNYVFSAKINYKKHDTI